MINVRIETTGALLSGQAPEIIQRNLDAAIVEITMFLWREIQSRTPQGVGGSQSGLHNAIKTQFIGKGTPVSKGIIFHSKPYGDVIEKGRTAGKGISEQGQESLAQWIRVKLGITDPKKLRQVTFLISRKIKAKGFEGAHMFEQAFKDNETRIDAIATRYGFAMVKELDA